MNPPIRDWRGKRVWVVGASSGIGAALADALAGCGARVAVSARRSAPLEDFVARHGADALALPLDVTDVPAWEAACRQLRQVWGGIDLVVFLAASWRPTRAWELEAADARGTVETNVIGVINGLASVLPELLRSRGGVALVSSVAGYRGLPLALTYGPTKAALINLAEVLYLDLAPRGVAVYLVNPGFVRTPLTAENSFPMPGLMEPEAAARRIIRGLERGRFEIAFPRRLVWPLKLLRLLPYRLYLPLVRRWAGA
ncbi:MAG: SDR family NAD(P)-dependent oxidoreductase [Ectothiorhodospiraceae bacterium]|nr:SDR family NAD(P)-dependent oxidoreductase [Ectothiorhodospiraceae bacterium]